MAKEPQTRDDFENMSDEDFMKLSEEDYSGNVPEGETSLTNEDLHAENQVPETPVIPEELEGSDTSDGDSQSGESNDDPDSKPDGEENKEEEGTGDEGGSPDPMAGEGEEASTDPEKGKQPKADSEEKGKKTPETSGDGSDVKDPDAKPKGDKAETPAKAGYYKLPDGMDSAKIDEALGFFKTITAPFKADGKDFNVRSPEDAIRLMQQGVNYSRRMQEIKPMKALNRVLHDNGLADQNKLNFAIDLMKGDKGAITQLLKSHKIDPMDLDVEKDSGYQANNYQGDPQDNDFRDALDHALTSPDGQALVSHIHKDWDLKSKAKLREDPSIIGNLSEMKASGVYDKVVKELRYQQGLGYLTNVPFLQAFDQVGEAMKNAGVFSASENPAQNGNSMAPLNTGQTQNQPVASGGRKSTDTKKSETNPHLSSTPPAKQSGNANSAEPDFGKMSDEDFLKMPPPE